MLQLSDMALDFLFPLHIVSNCQSSRSSFFRNSKKDGADRIESSEIDMMSTRMTTIYLENSVWFSFSHSEWRALALYNRYRNHWAMVTNHVEFLLKRQRQFGGVLDKVRATAGEIVESSIKKLRIYRYKEIAGT